MHNKTYGQINQIMLPYSSKGKKSAFKKKQIKRLISIFDDIFISEKSEDLRAIGKRQIIGHWRRIAHETDKTRKEKYSILKCFFSFYKPIFKVPRPKPTFLK